MFCPCHGPQRLKDEQFAVTYAEAPWNDNGTERIQKLFRAASGDHLSSRPFMVLGAIYEPDNKIRTYVQVWREPYGYTWGTFNMMDHSPIKYQIIPQKNQVTTRAGEEKAQDLVDTARRLCGPKLSG
jgi:hypothetical protein